MRRILFALALGAVALPATMAAAATASAPQACINTHANAQWKAKDNKTLYVAENKSTVFAVEFAGGCPRMASPFTHFIQLNRTGTSQVCAPIDLDVQVADQSGFTTSCLATGIRKLSAPEIQALPKQYKR